MTKWVFGLLIVLVLLISACSLQEYLPDTMVNVSNTSESGNGTVQFNDTFEFVNTTTNETDKVTNQTNTSELNSSLFLRTITVTEGEIANLNVHAEDPDGDAIQLSYSQPFNEQGLWQTNEGDAGKYLVTVKASDGILSTIEQVQVIVLPTNKGPVIDCPSSFEVREGDNITLPCLIYDREGDNETFSVSGFMHNLSYETSFGDAGEHKVLITADDGQRKTVKEINLTVLKQNRAPIVEPLPEITVQEGDEVDLSIEAVDPDGDQLQITYPPLFDSNGVWKTEHGDAGIYDLEAVVSDGEANVAVKISIVVEKVNIPPTLEPIDDIQVNEGDTITLDIVANDSDGDNLTTTISGFMTTDTYTTGYDDAGEHWVLVHVSDGKASVEQNVSITVVNVNRPPVFVRN